jgi:hypothetical protein
MAKLVRSKIIPSCTATPAPSPCFVTVENVQ